MTTAKSIDMLLQDIRLIGVERHDTVQAVRTLVKKLVKPLSEEVKYGGILFSSADGPFGGVFAYKDHVSVEFGHGARIDDTLGHLEGAGKFRRHLKLRSEADIAGRQLARYIPLAIEASREAA